jgi:hypothetical protein
MGGGAADTQGCFLCVATKTLTYMLICLREATIVNGVGFRRRYLRRKIGDQVTIGHVS